MQRLKQKYFLAKSKKREAGRKLNLNFFSQRNINKTPAAWAFTPPANKK